MNCYRSQVVWCGTLLAIIVFLGFLRLPVSQQKIITGELKQTTYYSETNTNIFLFDDKEHLIFAHVPKTSGTSMSRFFADLAKQRGWSKKLFYTDANFSNISSSRFLYGHKVNILLGVLEGRNYTLAMLRRPLDRVISSYKHHLRAALGNGNTITFEDLFTRIPEKFCNRQWNVIFGDERVFKRFSTDMIDRFLQQASKTYLLLLLYERRIESFAILSKAFLQRGSNSSFAFNPCEQASFATNLGINESSIPGELTQISFEHLRKLEECNQLDFALYQHAMRQFDQLTKGLNITCT